MSFVCFFFFKQKTAYEMRISDWSSDVCSSDLHDEVVIVELADLDQAGLDAVPAVLVVQHHRLPHEGFELGDAVSALDDVIVVIAREIGRASCRESVCQYVSISVAAVSLKTNTSQCNITK